MWERKTGTPGQSEIHHLLPGSFCRQLLLAALFCIEVSVIQKICCSSHMIRFQRYRGSLKLYREKPIHNKTKREIMAMNFSSAIQV